MNERIVIDPKICHGKPVIRGTRTPVAVIVGSLAGGDSFETIQREYDITADDIRAALAFAAKAVDVGNGSTFADPGCFRDLTPGKPLSAEDKETLRELLTPNQFEALLDVSERGGPDVEAIARIRAASMT
jgi:uncharacterized protein (DUF433 family)